jgi:hypothetical protein
MISEGITKRFIGIDGGRRDILQKRSLVSKIVNGESFED